MVVREHARSLMVWRRAIFKQSQPARLRREPALRIPRLTVCNPTVNGEERPSIRRALSARVPSVTLNPLVTAVSGRWPFPLPDVQRSKALENQN
jgi:hypothetical protein